MPSSNDAGDSSSAVDFHTKLHQKQSRNLCSFGGPTVYSGLLKYLDFQRFCENETKQLETDGSILYVLYAFFGRSQLVSPGILCMKCFFFSLAQCNFSEA